MARSILIVDDDDALRSALARMLRAAGYEVRSAPGADEALRDIPADKPDLLITDIMMPLGDGVELIREMRRRWPDVAIVAMSGRSLGQLDVLKAAERLGAVASLSKPFSSDELLLTVEDVLARPPAPPGT